MDQERQYTRSSTGSGGGAATAVDYQTLSTAELTEIRFAKLNDWLDEGHVTSDVRENIVAFIDAVGQRAGFEWAASDNGDVGGAPT